MGHRGKVEFSSYEEDIKEAVLLILRTARGERVMRPDFGCGINEYVFTTMDTLNLNLIENTVWEALTVWEPRIELIEVRAEPDPSKDGMLLVNIDYMVRSSNTRFNLVYPFYINEGV